ncbi:MAG: ATP-binding protein [Acidimicrobiales bacterium]|nr:ATP-binding protein [Acidimicrobiales bacterium]
MIAMTGSSDAPGDTTHGRRTLPTRPDHLVVWLRGHTHDDDDRVIDDGRLGGEFSLVDWVDEIRDGYPDAVLGATYPPVSPGVDGAAPLDTAEDWLELIRTAAGVDAGGDERSFTGDTTPTSLQALRRWAVPRVERRGFPLHDVVLAVSELATNVERHGQGWLTVDVVDRGDALVLAVTDPATDQLPAPRNVEPHETAGRGLLVVASVATRWGLVVRPAHKTVWAAFPRSAG